MRRYGDPLEFIGQLAQYLQDMVDSIPFMVVESLDREPTPETYAGLFGIILHGDDEVRVPQSRCSETITATYACTVPPSCGFRLENER
jgi:hypothetical protein